MDTSCRPKIVCWKSPYEVGFWQTISQDISDRSLKIGLLHHLLKIAGLTESDLDA